MTPHSKKIDLIKIFFCVLGVSRVIETAVIMINGVFPGRRTCVQHVEPQRRVTVGV